MIRVLMVTPYFVLAASAAAFMPAAMNAGAPTEESVWNDRTKLRVCLFLIFEAIDEDSVKVPHEALTEYGVPVWVLPPDGVLPHAATANPAAAASARTRRLFRMLPSP
jgi:hypothetical protein